MPRKIARPIYFLRMEGKTCDYQYIMGEKRGKLCGVKISKKFPDRTRCALHKKKMITPASLKESGEWKNYNCEHGKYKYNCSTCDPESALRRVVSSRLSRALPEVRGKNVEDYLGCTIGAYKTHIESTFTGGMSWANYGTKWEIDHIRPISRKLSQEVKKERMHYTNTKALDKSENRKKGSKDVAE